MQNLSDAPQLLGLYTVFILLFVTLGPIKVVGPFMQLTRDVDEATMKKHRPARVRAGGDRRGRGRLRR